MASSGYSVGKSTLVQLRRERDKLGRFVSVVESAPYRIMVEESARILQEMQLQVPYDSGQLYDSLRCVVEGNKLTPQLIATASAKDNGYDYAGIQHDTPWFNHMVGKWRYVADPFEAGVERINRRLREELHYE